MPRGEFVDRHAGEVCPDCGDWFENKETYNLHLPCLKASRENDRRLWNEAPKPQRIISVKPKFVKNKNK